jgi:hypothetical protein
MEGRRDPPLQSHPSSNLPKSDNDCYTLYKPQGNENPWTNPFLSAGTTTNSNHGTVPKATIQPFYHSQPHITTLWPKRHYKSFSVTPKSICNRPNYTHKINAKALHKQKKPSKSRRITQRPKKRKLRHIEQTNNINARQETYHSEKCCIEQFGVQANPRLSIRQNFNKAIKNKNLNTPMLPTNLTFHNLTAPGSLPPNTKQLLGLNLKFCIANNLLPNTIKKKL